MSDNETPAMMVGSIAQLNDTPGESPAFLSLGMRVHAVRPVEVPLKDFAYMMPDGLHHVRVVPDSWDRRFLDLARLVAGWSKDPSTKVGAVIVRPNKTVASMGFNGFPRGIKDDGRLTDRAVKYEITIHAEENALLMASERLDGYTAYIWPLPPCSRCAAKLIQSGIARVVSPPAPAERWNESCQLGRDLLCEAGVEVEVL